MESQPQNPEFRINPETYTHMCSHDFICFFCQVSSLVVGMHE